jgi:hypothetical protein
MATKRNPAAGGGGARNADFATGAVPREQLDEIFRTSADGPIDRLAARIKATEPLQPLLAQCRWVMWRYEASPPTPMPSACLPNMV